MMKATTPTSFIAYVILPILFLVVVYWVAKRFFGSRRVEDVSNKYVLITGCDSGFGRLTAINLDLLGFRVIATCLTKEGKEELKEVCSQRVNVFLLDVTDSKQIKQIFSDVCRDIIPRGVGLWALINNAGIFIPGPIEWQTLDTYKRTADVNLWGLIDMSKTFLPLVKKAKGRIINMSSVAGRASLTYISSYCISKFGVEAFSDALRREVKPWGVKVILMEPGGFKTSLIEVEKVKKVWKKQWEDLGSEAKEVYDEEFVNTAHAAFLNTFSNASDDLTKVVKALEGAVTSLRPRNRYLIGADAHVLAAVFSLPSAASDAIANAMVPTFMPKKN